MHAHYEAPQKVLLDTSNVSFITNTAGLDEKEYWYGLHRHLVRSIRTNLVNKAPCQSIFTLTHHVDNPQSRVKFTANHL